MSRTIIKSVACVLALLLVHTFCFAKSKGTAAQIVDDEGTSSNLERFERTNPADMKKRKALLEKYVADVLAGRDPEKPTAENSESRPTQSDK